MTQVTHLLDGGSPLADDVLVELFEDVHLSHEVADDLKQCESLTLIQLNKDIHNARCNRTTERDFSAARTRQSSSLHIVISLGVVQETQTGKLTSVHRKC